MTSRLIERCYIFRGRILDLSTNRYELGDEGEVNIEIIHHPGGAGALPVFDDGTVGLVRQFRYPRAHHSLEIPAGRIESGDTPLQTASRELEEELGYRARQLEPLAEFNTAPGFCEERIHVYLARGLTRSNQKLDPDESIEVVRLSPGEALSMVNSGEIDDAKTIIAILLGLPGLS